MFWHGKRAHDVAVGLNDIVRDGSMMETIDHGARPGDPLGARHQEAAGHDQQDRAPVVERVNVAFRIGLAELLLVQNGDVLAYGGEKANDPGHG